ncbi:biotin transporter BioY [Caloranaerobacter azorensis]|uniref:Biotin transporter n=1 Tax=Caloranaerobacter azorensis TaxID=116090 RepID=A0A6P1YGA7_9FIRM|nr:biotin transporter BioY [Caloranaerobacter azorensis]QIB27738.1 biotin transporter BioY [Caloranaerobacter azorensis]
MRIKIRDMILVSLFAALTAIGAFIRIPTPIVPFTLQFLFCAYAGTLLGSRLGLISQLLYVGIGLAGVPIFTKGGGISYIFQPTFGYLIGFILCAYVIGKLTENLKEITFIKYFVIVVAGLMIVYGIGVPYLYLIVNYYLGKDMTFRQAIYAGFALYIIPDLLLSALVAFTSVKVIPTLKKLGYKKGK